MIQDSEYESLATIAVNKLVVMPTNSSCRKVFFGSSWHQKQKAKPVENSLWVDAWSFGRANYTHEIKKTHWKED